MAGSSVAKEREREGEDLEQITIMTAAVSDSVITAAHTETLGRQNVVGAGRGPAVTAFLQRMAVDPSALSNVANWEMVRDVLFAEVSRAFTICLRVHEYQLANGAKPRSNQQQFDESSLLEEFQADVEYVQQQLRTLRRAPPTCQRVAEILLRPFQFHTRAAAATLSAPVGCTNVELEMQLEDGEGIGDDDIVRRDAWTFQLQALRPTLLISALRKLLLVMPVDSMP